MTANRQLAVMAADGGPWVDLDQVAYGSGHADNLPLLVIEGVRVARLEDLDIGRVDTLVVRGGEVLQNI